MTANAFSTAPSRTNPLSATAGWGLSVLLLVAVALFGCWIVGSRPLDIGTDTSVYAAYFERLKAGQSETRMEPGFVGLSYLLSRFGLSTMAYQAALFGALMLTVWASTRRYFSYLGDTRGYLTFLSASVMLLFLSPMFVNASINAIRQGLAALLVFASLLSFQRRQWLQFVLYGAVATSLHYSSLLYIAFAPMLVLRANTLRYVAVAGLLVYCSGLSMLMVQMLAPGLYGFIQEYAANENSRTGIRIDFAIFSAFWYAIPYFASSLLRSPYKERIQESTAVYLVMLIPFFAIGWGYFSNRFLLPAWLAVSLIMAAILCHNRFQVLRHPLAIRAGLVLSCGFFFYYVTNDVVI